MSQGSIMPAYPFLLEKELDTSSTPAKINAMITLGVPYPKGYAAEANSDLMAQATEIANNLKNDSIRIAPNREVIALIAYMQRLGADISKTDNVKK